MKIEDCKLVAIDRREKLGTRLNESLASSKETEHVIEQSNVEIQELSQELKKNQNLTTELTLEIQLTNSYAEKRRLQQRLTRLKIASRKIKQNRNTIKGTMRRNQKFLMGLTKTISLYRDKIVIYNHIINDLTELNNQELMEGIISLVLAYQEHPDILEVFNGIIELVSFRIREYVDAQIQVLKENLPDDLTNLDGVIRKYNNWLATPNMSKELFKACLRFLDIIRIRFPDLEIELQIIDNYKKQNPNWWYDDYSSVLKMYIPLRQKFGVIPQEFNDLELVLNSMVEELQGWEHEHKPKWILKRIKDMEDLIENYIHIYPQIGIFFNPINYHKKLND